MLKVENVGVKYMTGDFKDIGLKEYVMRKIKKQYHAQEFWAVDNVSFEVSKGDFLGIVGVNGAGKSTLMRAVSGILEPTRGRIERAGRVTPLLDLGSGFDPDLTVKENAYLRGAMLQYTRKYMDEKYKEIIEFSDLKEFENRVFRQLSSGMQVRLAFSISSMVDPEILILDEVLSVGDGIFREKSAKKMQEIIAKGSVTILVSHILPQINELCNKVLWMDRGKQIAFGPTSEVLPLYKEFLSGKTDAVHQGGLVADQ